MVRRVPLRRARPARPGAKLHIAAIAAVAGLVAACVGAGAGPGSSDDPATPASLTPLPIVGGTRVESEYGFSLTLAPGWSESAVDFAVLAIGGVFWAHDLRTGRPTNESPYVVVSVWQAQTADLDPLEWWMSWLTDQGEATEVDSRRLSLPAGPAAHAEAADGEDTLIAYALGDGRIADWCPGAEGGWMLHLRVPTSDAAGYRSEAAAMASSFALTPVSAQEGEQEVVEAFQYLLCPSEAPAQEVAEPSCPSVTAADLPGRLVFVGSGAICVAAFDGSPPIVLHSGSYDGYSSSVDEPAWSPDGQWVAFSVHIGVRGAFDEDGIGIVRADGTDFRTISPGDGWFFAPTWSPDGRTLAVVSPEEETEKLLVIDLADEGVHEWLESDWVTDPSWSPIADEIAVDVAGEESDEESWIAIAASDGVLRRLTTPGAGVFDGAPDWSPDGASIAFDRSDVTGEDGRVMIMDATGLNIRELGGDPEIQSYPVWSPDGNWLGYVSLDEDAWAWSLYVQPATGGEAQLIVEGLGGSTFDWGP